MDYIELTLRQFLNLCLLLDKKIKIFSRSEEDIDLIHIRIEQPQDVNTLAFSIGKA